MLIMAFHCSRFTGDCPTVPTEAFIATFRRTGLDQIEQESGLRAGAGRALPSRR
jgi:hypothetical protein